MLKIKFSFIIKSLQDLLQEELQDKFTGIKTRIQTTKSICLFFLPYSLTCKTNTKKNFGVMIRMLARPNGEAILI